MSWASIMLLAAGAYLLKALGLLLFGPATGRGASHRSVPVGAATAAGPDVDGEGNSDGDGDSERLLVADPFGGLAARVGRLLPPALLAALVVSQTVVTDGRLVVDARLAGVMAGAAAVWRGAPFWLVLLIAAAVTALIRLAGS